LDTPAARADNRIDLCIDVETTDKSKAKERKGKERYAKRDEERDER
jgi:hypothetical protein